MEHFLGITHTYPGVVYSLVEPISFTPTRKANKPRNRQPKKSPAHTLRFSTWASSMKGRRPSHGSLPNRRSECWPSHNMRMKRISPIPYLIIPMPGLVATIPHLHGPLCPSRTTPSSPRLTGRTTISSGATAWQHFLPT